MFHVVCDGCRADVQESSDYVAWAELDTARIQPSADGWWTDGDDRDLCPDCWDKSDEALTREPWPVTAWTTPAEHVAAMRCTTCGGSGRVADPATAGHPVTDDVACPTCDGA